MQKLRQLLVLSLASAFLLVLAADAQDDAQPSLGDVARQARQQKQQKDAQPQPKDASSKDSQTNAPGKDAQAAKDKDKAAVARDTPAPKPPHVITNEELPEHIGPTRTRPAASKNPESKDDQPSEDDGGKASAEDWQSQIMAQKSAIANLKSDIDSLSASIQYAGANCVANCVEWNERQKQKQEQVESMKAQLAEQQKRLEEMQESARKQGFGSSVYDP